MMEGIEDWLRRATIDPTISLEAGVGALALLAAALGYLANLVGAYRRRREDERIYGDKLVLLELLKAEPLRGLSEAALLERLRDPNGVALANQLKATAPSMMTEDTIERRLRSLQFEGMVDPTVSGTYVLRTGFSKSSERTELIRARKAAHLLQKIHPDQLLAALKLEDGQGADWTKREVTRAYAALGTAPALDELARLVASEDPEAARLAAEAVAEFLRDADVESLWDQGQPTATRPRAMRSQS
jgi:hypothetical protein